MNAITEPNRGLVALVGLTPPERQSARDAVTLAGAPLCEDPARASLILASPSAPVPAFVPCVRVGDGGQVSLPRDRALLVSLIAEASWRSRTHGAVWVVSGIAGGVGTTSVVRLLARENTGSQWSRRLPWGRGLHTAGTRPWRGEARNPKRAPGGEPAREGVVVPVAVDASGSVPGIARAAHHDLPGVRWADLHAGEDSYLPALRDHLPIIDGVPALVGDTRGGADAGDPRVPAACRSIGAPLIVDAGRWDTRAARLAALIHADAIVLLTHGDLEGAAAMAVSLAVAPPPVPALTLVVGERAKPSPGLVECAPTPILRAPTRRGRYLRALRRSLEDIAPPPATDPSQGLHPVQPDTSHATLDALDPSDAPNRGHPLLREHSHA